MWFVLIGLMAEKILLSVVSDLGRPSIMANGTIAFDTLSTSGQITGTAKSLDTDYFSKCHSKSCRWV